MAKPIIICVDDEKSVLNTLEEQILSHLGEDFEVELASSANEAIELINEIISEGLKIALIISDQLMPGMKGDEFLIEVHKKLPEVAKILLTGQAKVESIQNAIDKAALYRYISKPWELNDLLMTVKTASNSYIQKQKIDSYGESIRLLKDINTATRKLSSEINANKLSGKYLEMVEAYTQFDSCFIVFNKNKNIVVDAYDMDNMETLRIQGLLKNDNELLYNEVMALVPNFQGYIDKTDRIMLPLSSRESNFGFVFAFNKEKRPIHETEFEMFKVLTMQLLVSFETAKLYQNIENQKKLIERKNKSIQHSLDYAHKIQESLLPDMNEFKEVFPNSFVWYSPKDTVSGDFYIFRKIENKVFLISADCTGHGVPGAFITILGRMILREIIRAKESDPANILSALDSQFVKLFHRNGETDIKDGMDAAIVVYDIITQKFIFSGAKMSIYTVNQQGVLNRIKGSKYEIGNYIFKDVEDKFQSIDLDLQKGDKLYLACLLYTSPSPRDA